MTTPLSFPSRATGDTNKWDLPLKSDIAAIASVADTAKALATTANSNATSAGTTAGTAQTTASNAALAAAAAQADADAAQTAASNAQTSANNAAVAAVAAQGTANGALSAANEAKARALTPETTFSATAYTAVLADALTAKRSTASAAVTFTLPPASSVAWLPGTIIEIQQGGTGQVTVPTGVNGVTVTARDGLRRTAGQEASMSVRYVGGDVWRLTGDVG